MLQTQLNKFSRSFVEVAFYDLANKILNIFKAKRPSVMEFLMIVLTKLLACMWSKQLDNNLPAQGKVKEETTIKR